MNGFEGKDRSSFHVIGKGFLIAIVTVFSSLGFVLGYFVGKGGQEGIPAGYSQDSEAVPVQREIVQVQPEERGDVFNEEVGSGPEQQENDQMLRQKVSPPAEDEVSLSARGIPDDSVAAEPVSAGTVSVRPRGAGTDGTSLKSAAPSGGKEGKAQTAELIYTVQLGAFKNETEAENFITIYDKKGYKPYITVSRNKKNEKIYRIRSGEFKERKSAEILAMKLKKTEGLNTYVTFKNE
jgi:cell division septation protein DedD